MDKIDPRVRAQMEALLLRPVCEPLERAFGEYGSLLMPQFLNALAKALEHSP